MSCTKTKFFKTHLSTLVKLFTWHSKRRDTFNAVPVGLVRLLVVADHDIHDVDIRQCLADCAVYSKQSVGVSNDAVQ
jgi:hypothetical protein